MGENSARERVDSGEWRVESGGGYEGVGGEIGRAHV